MAEDFNSKEVPPLYEESREKPTYKKYTGKSGRIWLVANQENKADNIYVEGGKNSDGFGGATLTFQLDDGTSLDLKGPWHSNTESFLADTGVDLTSTSKTFGVVGLSRASSYPHTIINNVIWRDKKWRLGKFERVRQKAQELANKRGETVYYYHKTAGGSSSGPVSPNE